MLGIYLSLVGAVILVFADVLKKQFSSEHPFEIVVWNTVLVGIFFAAAACLIAGAQVLDAAAFIWLPLTIVLLIAGEITFIKSLTLGDLSEVAPLRAVSPVFSVLFALLVLGEFPTPLALGGVALVVSGVWFITPRPAGSQVRVLSKAARYMILSQFIGVLMGITIKIASAGISPLIYFLCCLLGELAYFSIIIQRKKFDAWALYKSKPAATLTMGSLWGVGLVAVSIAPAYTLVAYAYASSQIYLPVAMLVSAYVLKERQVSKRILPMLLLLCGVILVIFGAAVK